MKSASLFKIAGEVSAIAHRHGIEIGDDELSAGAIIEKVRTEIFNRGRSYRDDLRALRRLADALAAEQWGALAEDATPANGADRGHGNGEEVSP
jgi:hypothetical protein